MVGLILCSTTLLAGPFHRIISFGDSLSDSGFASEYTGEILPPDYRFPLGDGRASDGPVWVEYLADDLDVELTNYAFFGAMTDTQNYNDPDWPPIFNIDLVGFLEEVNFYLNDLGDEKVHSRDLFTVMIGANDFFAYLGGDPALILQGVNNTLVGISMLAEAGARHIVVANVPDLSITPGIILSGANTAQVQGLVMYYNSLLAQGLESVADTYDCNIVMVDTFTILQQIFYNKEDYGLINVEYPVINPFTFEYPLAPPDLSLFWDLVHPTTAGHRIIADGILDTILDEYVPGQAIGLDRNVPGWARR